MQADHVLFPKVWISPSVKQVHHCMPTPRRCMEAGDEAEGLNRAFPIGIAQFSSTLQRGSDKETNLGVPKPEGNLEQDAPEGEV